MAMVPFVSKQRDVDDDNDNDLFLHVVYGVAHALHRISMNPLHDDRPEAYTAHLVTEHGGTGHSWMLGIPHELPLHRTHSSSIGKSEQL